VLARTGNRYTLLLVPGLLLIAASYGTFALCGPDTAVWRLVGLVLVMGLGLGVFMQTVLAAMQNSVPPAHLGVASGLYGFSRQVGGIAGTAALLSVLFGTATASIVDRYDEAVDDGRVSAALADPAVRDDPVDRAVLDGLAAGTAGIDLDDSSALSAVDPRVAEPVLAGLDDAMSIVFLILAALVALAAVLALTIREKRPAPAAPVRASAAPPGAPAGTGQLPADSVPGATRRPEADRRSQ
jgi:MFS family permease